jgi:hypothetical protein
MRDLFDHAARTEQAMLAKDRGMAQVAENADAAWADLMLELVRLTCLEQPRFTVDDPMDRYELIEGHKPATHELRAMGPVMMRAARAGYCRKAYAAPIPSRRRSLHASPRAVWESLIYARG